MPRKVLVTSTKCLVSLGLSFLLAVPDVARAAPQAPAPAKLNIVIVEGEGAINNIRQRTAREPIVQVEDENRRPVAGAAVLFLLPEDGPGGRPSRNTRTRHKSGRIAAPPGWLGMGPPLPTDPSIMRQGAPKQKP